MRRLLPVLLLATMAGSCSSTISFRADYPLTQKVFHASDGAFAGRIPEGWFAADGDTLAPALSAWLLREDLSASFAIRELNLDPQAARRVEEEGLMLLARLSAGFRESIGDPAGLQCVEFETAGRRYCTYQTGLGGRSARIIVFRAAGGKFYECEV